MSIANIKTEFPAWIKSLPILEGTIFLVLATITIFRKRLSSNDKYRSDYLTKKVIVPMDTSLLSSINNSNSSTEPIASIVNYITDAPTTSFVHIVNDVAKSVYRRTIGTNMDAIHSSLSNFNHEKSNMSLSTLTQDNLWHIVEFLSSSDICKLGGVCKSLCKETMEERIWEQLWISRYIEMWQHPTIKSIREKRLIYWNPKMNYPSPQQGWKKFYREFEICWKDWLLAGACSPTYCLIALYGSILDVTTFLPSHPGSLESLTDYAGGDATEQFLDIGHSSLAYHLSLDYIVYQSKYEISMEQKTIEFEKKLGSNYNIAYNKKFNRFITKFEVNMKKQGRKVCQTIESTIQVHSCAYLDYNSRMIPSIEKYHNCAILSDGIHVGQCRSCWDPLEQRWYVWWTCCGCGGAVDDFNDFPDI